MSAITEKRREIPSDARYGKVETNGVGGETSRETSRGLEPGRLENERPPLLRFALRRIGERRAKAGAPPLACNVWLEAQIEQAREALPPYRHLYKEWLERYYALRGYYPADPKRSFRAAVASCLNRLRR